VRRNLLAIDAGIAAVLALLVIIISPGLAVAGMIAILILLVCGVSFALDSRAARARRAKAVRRPNRGR
jgi:hypothetical protein